MPPEMVARYPFTGRGDMGKPCGDAAKVAPHFGDNPKPESLEAPSHGVRALHTVLAQHVDPQHHQHAHIGEQDDGRGPSGAVDMEIRNRIEHRRGEELQRMRGDVEENVEVPRDP